MRLEAPTRARSTLLAVVLLWLAVYASVTLLRPPLLDDADSVHAEVAREMLLRGDYVTLHANGIRYLEKAPLFYWAMAAAMRTSQLLGHPGPRALAVAARLPLALAMLALALLCEAMARRIFASARAGLYAALMVLSSCGLFLFTRMLIPDAEVCLWTTLAMLALWQTEQQQSAQSVRKSCWLFALACALNVLTKGLIGVVFPVAIAVLYWVVTRGVGGAWRSVRQMHLVSSTAVFLAVAAPWHILAALANPGHGRPTPFRFAWNASHTWGHWLVPLPTDGNVRGWTWFYFMNEHVLRYLSLRVPHDYDTAPLWIFWGLCLVWLMPWSAFGWQVGRWAVPMQRRQWRTALAQHVLPQQQRDRLLLVVWAGFVLLFFAASSRQEYYVLPALPALAMLAAGWLAGRAEVSTEASKTERRALLVLLGLGMVYAVFAVYALVHTQVPPPGTDLATLLREHPADYALSLGHFLDLDLTALGMFHVALWISAPALLLGPTAALWLQWRSRRHASYLALFGFTFLFLSAAYVALVTFSPVLTSAQLAEAIRPQVQPEDMVCIHGEYEAGSTLGFYLQRPSAVTAPIHILEGRSSNLWYGSFFPDAPKIFETPESIAARWAGPQRIFLWQSVTDPPNTLPQLPGPVYILVKSGGKEIVSNQPNR